MSLTYKYEEHSQDGQNKGEEKQSEDSGIHYYKTPGNIRNLRLVNLDGTSYFFNYAYFGAVKYSAEKSYIAFQAQGYEVFMKGYGLKELHQALHGQLPLEIVCIDPRYLNEGNPPNLAVTKMVIRVARNK